VTLLRQEGWTRWPTEVPANPYDSVILWPFLATKSPVVLVYFLSGEIWHYPRHILCCSNNRDWS